MGNSFFGAPSDFDVRIQSITDWWMGLSQSEDAGCSSWEDLDRIRDEVTEALSRCPPAIGQAEHLTAKALLMISGQIVI